MINEYLNDVYIIPSFLSMKMVIYISIIYIAVIVSLMLIHSKLIKVGYEKRTTNRLISFSFVISLFSIFIGSKLSDMFYLNPAMWDWQHFLNGIVIGTTLTYHSGFIVAFLLLVGLVRIMQLGVLATIDTFALYIPVGHAIGRMACLLLGCCWGGRLSLTLHNHNVHFLNPVPLYSITFNLLLFLIFKYFYQKIYEEAPLPHKSLQGMIVALYFVSYGIGRFVLEFIRTEPVIYRGLTQAQFAMLFFIAVGISLIVTIFINKKALAYRG